MKKRTESEFVPADAADAQSKKSRAQNEHGTFYFNALLRIGVKAEHFSVRYIKNIFHIGLRFAATATLRFKDLSFDYNEVVAKVADDYDFILIDCPP